MRVPHPFLLGPRAALPDAPPRGVAKPTSGSAPATQFSNPMCYTVAELTRHTPIGVAPHPVKPR